AHFDLQRRGLRSQHRRRRAREVSAVLGPLAKLWPPPQHIALTEGSCELPQGVDLTRLLEDQTSPNVFSIVNPALLSKPERYRLLIEKAGSTLAAADQAGRFYGARTLRQVALCAGQTSHGRLLLPTCRIEDWPDFPHRGVMLDVSRDKVPTMATLFELVEM